MANNPRWRPRRAHHGVGMDYHLWEKGYVIATVFLRDGTGPWIGGTGGRYFGSDLLRKIARKVDALNAKEKNDA